MRKCKKRISQATDSSSEISFRQLLKIATEFEEEQKYILALNTLKAAEKQEFITHAANLRKIKELNNRIHARLNTIAALASITPHQH